LGSTTTPLLIFLNKRYPEDKIFCVESTPLAEQENEDAQIEDDRRSIGMITRIE